MSDGHLTVHEVPLLHLQNPREFVLHCESFDDAITFASSSTVVLEMRDQIIECKAPFRGRCVNVLVHGDTLRR